MAVISLVGCVSAPQSRQTIQMMRMPLKRSAAADARATKADAWNHWAAQHLQTGDLVFLRGENRVLLDTINLAEFFTTLTDSPWLHVGLVVVEEGAAVVYGNEELGLWSNPHLQTVLFVSDTRLHPSAHDASTADSL